MKQRALILGLAMFVGHPALGGLIVAKSVGHSDVASAIAAANPGDTVVIPEGSASWTAGVSVKNGIQIRGSGAGRIVGTSTTSTEIGKGSKTLVTQEGLDLANGQIVRVARTGNRDRFIQGTVTDYTGTSLTINVDTTGGTGTDKLWLVSTEPSTVIVNDYSATPFSATALFILEEQPQSIQLSGIKMAAGAGNAPAIRIVRQSGGAPILISNMWIETRSTSGNDAIYSTSNRGVVWNCSFDCSPFSRAPLAFHHVCYGERDSWSTPSTMGDADTSGTSNFYFEDCDFHAWLNAVDLDSNSRSVFRHCQFNNAGLGTHGADSGPYGVRHYEVYDCEFIFNGYKDLSTFPLNWWFYLRGGTGVITDNLIPDMKSQDYGDKSEINITIQNLQRSSGPNPCWGADQPGIQYPAPRQVGMGYVSGNSGTDSVTYVGDSEPLYIWNNTGNFRIGFSNFGGTQCANYDSTQDYVVEGRDYHLSTPKPSYEKYTYPHPLRKEGGTPQAPTNPVLR